MKNKQQRQAALAQTRRTEEQQANADARTAMVEIVRPIIDDVVRKIGEERGTLLVMIGDADTIPMVTKGGDSRILNVAWALSEYSRKVVGLKLESSKIGGVYGSVEVSRRFKLSADGKMNEKKITAAVRKLIEDALDLCDRRTAENDNRNHREAAANKAEATATKLADLLPALDGVRILPHEADTCTLAITATPAELAQIAAMIDQLRN